jgi:hypothetical protein
MSSDIVQRLRALGVSDLTSKLAADRIEALEGEVGRLREALKEIAVVEPEWGTQWYIDVARKALEGRGE